MPPEVRLHDTIRVVSASLEGHGLRAVEGLHRDAHGAFAVLDFEAHGRGFAC